MWETVDVFPFFKFWNLYDFIIFSCTCNKICFKDVKRTCERDVMKEITFFDVDSLTFFYFHVFTDSFWRSSKRIDKKKNSKNYSLKKLNGMNGLCLFSAVSSSVPFRVKRNLLFQILYFIGNIVFFKHSVCRPFIEIRN